MKIYSWGDFLVCVVAGGVMLFFSLRTLFTGMPFAPFALIFWVCVVGYGGYISLSKEGFEKEQRRIARTRQAEQRLFGRFAPYFSRIPLFLFLLLAMFARLLAQISLWLPLGLLVLFCIFHLCYSIVIRKEIDAQQQREQQDGGALPPDPGQPPLP